MSKRGDKRKHKHKKIACKLGQFKHSRRLMLVMLLSDVPCEPTFSINQVDVYITSNAFKLGSLKTCWRSFGLEESKILVEGRLISALQK